MSEYVLTLLAAAAVTYILTPLVRRFAVAVGAMHAARERDVHELPTPLLGGFAIYGGLVAALLLASRLPGLSNVFVETNMEKGLLLAGGLVVIMGFVDDRWGMGALSKLAGQVAAGVILVWSGAEIPWIPAPGGVTLLLTSDQQIAVTILVVVVTMNAVNFIDGLDGLAAGIVGIGAIAFFAYYYTLTQRLGLVDQTEPALVSILLAGVCIGFLPHNFYPARIFMGDTGSLLIGLMLAYAPISSLALLDPASLTDTAAYSAGTVNRYGALIPLLVPAAILLIPYADLLMAVVRRTRAGKSVFAPDKKHLQHRLLAIGHSHRTSVLIMYLWAALFSGSVIWLSIVRTPLIVLAIVTVGAIVALLLVTMPRLRPWSRVTAGGGTARVARRAAPVPVPVKAAGERAAVTAPPERTAWQPDGRTASGGNGAPSSGARSGGTPRTGTADNTAAGNRTAGRGAGGNGASRGDPAERAGTGNDGTGNRSRAGGADPATGVPGAGVPGGGTTSGPGIPAAAISGGAPPWEDPRVGPRWDTVRGGPPWETVRGGPPWEAVRGGPPWETVPGDPPWDSVRGGPPWESIRRGPPWESAPGDRYWDTVRDEDPPAGPGSDPGAPPWPSEPPPLP
jgi:UDP-GlcNAc:undecaprenyl-phosphate/decaprenyl-phosphate GlcNAc-1-phosphate transferase